MGKGWEKYGTLGDQGDCFPSTPLDYQTAVCHLIEWDTGERAVLTYSKGQERSPQHSSLHVGSQVLRINDFILLSL